MPDKIEKVGKSIIQHGPLNNRIYLMYLHPQDVIYLAPQLIALAESQNYTKIFAKVPTNASQYFQRYGFFKEAYIPQFFNGNMGMYCMAKFFGDTRQHVPADEWQEICTNIKLAKSKAESSQESASAPVKLLQPDDMEELAVLYKIVFPSYPFPIDDPEFLKQNIKEDVNYFGIYEDGKLVAAASAEMDMQSKNAEMTDFATNPEFRGRGSAFILLEAMEAKMRELNIETCYTIARTLSAAMNITFAKNGYQFGGTLKNNTNIFGHIESMNVWYKNLR